MQNLTLLNEYATHGDEIKYPAVVQPKLDGHRCVAEIANGSVTLYRRGGGVISCLPHIADELAKIFAGRTLTLDGELYVYRWPLAQISAAVQRKTANVASMQVALHVFDAIAPGNLWQRRALFEQQISEAKNLRNVATSIVRCKSELREAYHRFLSIGSEGAVVRDITSEYTGGRTSRILKIKPGVDGDLAYRHEPPREKGQLIFFDHARIQPKQKSEDKIEIDLRRGSVRVETNVYNIGLASGQVERESYRTTPSRRSQLEKKWARKFLTQVETWVKEREENANPTR